METGSFSTRSSITCCPYARLIDREARVDAKNQFDGFAGTLNEMPEAPLLLGGAENDNGKAGDLPVGRSICVGVRLTLSLMATSR